MVDGDGTPLLGRNWLNKIKLDWHKIFVVNKSENVSRVSSVSSVSSVLNRHQAVLKSGLGTIKGHRADIRIKGGVSP